jgi:hypothetical protein
MPRIPGAKPKAVRERVNRKLRLRKRLSSISIPLRVAPRLSNGQKPPQDARESVERLLRAIRDGDPRTVIESLAESQVQPLLTAVNGLIIMQLGGWRTSGGKAVHASGVSFDEGALKVAGGRLAHKDGKPFAFCDQGKLHFVREALESTLRLLDAERKLDLFSGLKGMLHGRGRG